MNVHRKRTGKPLVTPQRHKALFQGALTGRGPVLRFRAVMTLSTIRHATVAIACGATIALGGLSAAPAAAVAIPATAVGPYTIVDSYDSMCLDGGSGTQVVLDSCNGSSGQQWYLQWGYEAQLTIINAANGECLGSGNGTDVVLGGCDSESSRTWHENDGGGIWNESTLTFLSGDPLTPPGQVELQDWVGGTGQQWLVTAVP